MFPDLVVDENVDFRIVQILKNSGFEIFSVVESCPGSSDREVLGFARKRKAVLVTEDHDFGEWVFAHHEPSFSGYRCAIGTLNTRPLPCPLCRF